MSEVLDLFARAPKPGELRKAINEANSDYIPPKSAIIDPLNQAGYGGTRQKPTPIPYSTLRRMAGIPAVSAIINTRLNQVARFAKRPRYNGDTGFRIGLKDPDEKMTDKQKKRAKEIEEFFLKTGWERNKVRKDNFSTFLRKIVRDSLTLDVVAFEKVGTFGGAVQGKQDVAEIWAIDGATIELVINNPIGDGTNYDLPVYKPETKAGMQNIGDLAYVQKVNGVVTAEYTEDELAFAIRNPRTDLDYVDFGMSELETLIEIVTGIVNGVRYNTSYFSHSHLPQGVLEIVGRYKDEHLTAFKRHWKTLTEGASGKWSVPVMGLEEGQGFKFTPFKNSNRDMEFNQFLEFLFNVACAVFQIDPNEVGFKSWTSGSGMTQSDNTQAKMDSSQDKGFHPLMDFLADTFNSEIVDLIDEDFVFEWVGVSEEDVEKKLEREKMEIEMGKKTINEIRKADDLDEIDEPWANAPANAQLIQVYMNGLQQEQAQQQQEQQQAQGEVDRQNAMQDGDMSHKRQLEVMDKQHQQGLEAKKLDQEHQTKITQMTAQQKAQADKEKAQKNTIKKSIEDDFRKAGIDIEWGDY
jgi:hypothetical protein